jgi:hypothetical protein
LDGFLSDSRIDVWNSDAALINENQMIDWAESATLPKLRLSPSNRKAVGSNQ